MNQYPRITARHSPAAVILLSLARLVATLKTVDETVISPYDVRGVTSQRAASLVLLGGLVALTGTYVAHRGTRSYALEVRVLWLGLELKLGTYPDLP